MDRQSSHAYQLNGFRLDLARRCLSANEGGTVMLSSRGYDVLAYLVDHRHRVVSKDELMKAVWPRAVVEENNLTQAISHVRRALGDARESPQFIATIAGRGYQFVGTAQPIAEDTGSPDVARPRIPDMTGEADTTGNAVATATEVASPVPAVAAVESVSGQARVAVGRRGMLLGLGAAAVIGGIAWMRWRSSAPAIKSIAVLPFKPLAGSARDVAVELGVAELLINRLSSLRDVVVSPLSSAIQFGAPDQDPVEAGRKLAVDAVVEGHVQIRDGQVRITARLLDTDDGRALWSGSFTESMHDFFAVQDSIASRIATAISAMAPAPANDAWTGYGTLDPDAWQLYADGRMHLNRRNADSVLRARAQFEAAQQRDPQFALAFAGSADAWTLAAIFGIEPTAMALTRAREWALQSLALSPDLADGHAALGHVLTQFERNFAGGREQYRRALELQPDHAWSHALLALNLTQSSRPADALRHIRQAQSLEPAALPFMALGAWVQYFAGEVSEAEQQLTRMVRSVPNAAMPTQFLARAMLTRRDAAAVIRLLEGRDMTAPGSFSNLGRAYAMAGRVAEARAEVARVEELGRRGIGVGFDLALIHLELGDRAAALIALERGITDHSQMMGYLNVDPALASVRDHARFRALARKIDFG